MCQLHLLLWQFQPNLLPPRTMLGSVRSWYIWKITNPSFLQKKLRYTCHPRVEKTFCWNSVFLTVFKYARSLFFFASGYPSIQIKTYLFYAQIKFLFGEKSFGMSTLVNHLSLIPDRWKQFLAVTTCIYFACSTLSLSYSENALKCHLWKWAAVRNLHTFKNFLVLNFWDPPMIPSPAEAIKLRVRQILQRSSTW